MMQAKLKLEIIAGYLIWISFFVYIILVVRQERQKNDDMERQEAHWQVERHETNHAFLHLLDLATAGELILGWNKEDYTAYREKRIATVKLLKELKCKQKDVEQHTCIDSICQLLTHKETMMLTLLKILENTPDAGDIFHKKIPAIALSTNKDSIIPAIPPQKDFSINTSRTKKKTFGVYSVRKKENLHMLYKRISHM